MGRSHNVRVSQYRNSLAVVAVTMTVMVRTDPVVMIVVRMSDHDHSLRTRYRNEGRYQANKTENSKRELLHNGRIPFFLPTIVQTES